MVDPKADMMVGLMAVQLGKDSGFGLLFEKDNILLAQL
jgi:hypothetical protein